MAIGIVAICARTAFAQPGPASPAPATSAPQPPMPQQPTPRQAPTPQQPAQPQPPDAQPPDAQPAQPPDAQPAQPQPPVGQPVQPQPSSAPGAVPPPPASPIEPDHRDRYPVELVDRPVVMPSGATLFDVSEMFSTHVQKIVDTMGNVTYRRTGFASDHMIDFEVFHVFGPVELGAGLGGDARVSAAIAAGALPLRIGIGASVGPTYNDDRYSYSQYCGATYKLLIAPHRFALAGGGSLYVEEARIHNAVGMSIAGTPLRFSGGVAAEIQLSRRWSIYGGPSTSVPLYESGFDMHSTLSTNLSVNFGFWKWDFFVNSALGDITRRPSTFLNIGFAKRWGL